MSLKYITTNEARELIARTHEPITNTGLIMWIKKYGLGKKVAGRYRINQEKLEKVLRGIDYED